MLLLVNLLQDHIYWLIDFVPYYYALVTCRVHLLISIVWFNTLSVNFCIFRFPLFGYSSVNLTDLMRLLFGGMYKGLVVFLILIAHL